MSIIDLTYATQFAVAAEVPGSIVIMADDGTELLVMTWADGHLDVSGPEDRWSEAAARFVGEVRRLLASSAGQ